MFTERQEFLSDREGQQVHVKWEVGELVTPDGFQHPHGKHKVSAQYDSGESYVRAKTFKGERAYDLAHNLYGKLIRDIELGRRP